MNSNRLPLTFLLTASGVFVSIFAWCVLGPENRPDLSIAIAHPVAPRVSYGPPADVDLDPLVFSTGSSERTACWNSSFSGSSFSSSSFSQASDRIRAPSVVGSVTDTKGVPLAVPWTLEIIGTRSAVESRDYPAGTNCFTLELPPGRWSLRPHAEERVGRTRIVDIVTGEMQNLVWSLEPSAVLSGWVLHDDGTRAPGISLALSAVDESRSIGDKQETHTRGDGTFVFSDLCRGRYRLTCGDSASPLVRPIEVEIEEVRAQVDTIRLPPLGSVRLHVLGPAGESLDGARVSGTGAHGGVIDCKTDREGNAVAANLPAGRYRLVATALGVGRGEIGVDVKRDLSQTPIEIRVVR